MAKPNFLYIGPSKAGSTWIYEALRLHPEVFLSRAKELHYFDLYYSLGPQWYFKHFQDVTPNHRIVGEISHDYLYSDDACARIKSDLDVVRFLVCLREPIERAFSEYQFMVRQGFVRKNFQEAIKRYPAILEHSLYGANLLRYCEKFGRSALVVTTFDDLKSDPESYFLKLCRDLGISEILPSAFPRGKVLEAAEPRHWILARMAKEVAMGMRRLGLAEAISRIKSRVWVQKLLYSSYKKDQCAEMKKDIREELNHYFLEDVLLLDKEFMPGVARLWGYD